MAKGSETIIGGIHVEHGDLPLPNSADDIRISLYQQFAKAQAVPVEVSVVEQAGAGGSRHHLLADSGAEQSGTFLDLRYEWAPIQGAWQLMGMRLYRGAIEIKTWTANDIYHYGADSGVRYFALVVLGTRLSILLDLALS